jgi:hypothetical protein
MPVDPVVNQIQILLNLWSKRAAKKSQGPLSNHTLKIRDFLKMLSQVIKSPFNYDQFRNYYDNNPIIQQRIKNLDKSTITILLPGEESEAEPEMEPVTEPVAPAAGEEMPPDETAAPEAEPAPAEAPSEAEPEKTGPGSRSLVAQMARRAQQRSRK